MIKIKIYYRKIKIWTEERIYFLECNQKCFQILHALGLFHEHQRPDRDQYINIDMAAADRTGQIHQFQKDSFLHIKRTQIFYQFGFRTSKRLRKLERFTGLPLITWLSMISILLCIMTELWEAILLSRSWRIR